MPKLRPRDIAALPKDTTPEQIAVLLGSSYDNFCSCVVAEATRKGTPPALRQVLRLPEWRDDWIDALTGAEANLQVAVLRARYEDGPHAVRVRNNTEALTAVRTRLHKVRAHAKRESRGRPHTYGTDNDPIVRAATKKLIGVYFAEYRQMFVAAADAAGVDPAARRADSDTTELMTLWALQVGAPAQPLTDRVRKLAALPDFDLDQVVARDVQQEPEEPDLTHTLLLDRWGESLDRLAQNTADLLGLPHRPMAALADVDLTVAGLDQDTAYRRINQFRFLAHVQQRWLEQKTLTRRFRRQIADWQNVTLGPVYAAARDELRRAYPDEFQQALEQAREGQAGPPSVDVPAPRPGALHPSSPVPQAAQVLAEKLTAAGWDARVDHQPGGDGDGGQARVDAARGDALLRAAYKRRNKGHGGGKGWNLMFVGVRVRGEGFVRLPKVSDALDLAVLPEMEFAERVAEYRASQDSPAVSRG